LAKWYKEWGEAMSDLGENQLSKIIIGAAIEVHRELGGPGLLEDVYEEALCYELSLQRVQVDRQVGVPLIYKGKELRKRLVLDVLAGEKVIVEVKAVEKYSSLFEAQLLTYLRLSNRKLGLVINFGETLVSDGVHRVVNKL
jgi:GxxExxY protein